MPTQVFVVKLTSTTVNVDGSKSVLVRKTGLGKAENNFDVSVLANGRKLTPFVIKRKIRPKEEFASGIIFKGNKKGWKAEELISEWLREFWKSRSSVRLNKGGILLVMYV